MSRLIKNLWIPAARELPIKEMPVLVCKKNSDEVFSCNFEDGNFRYIIGRDLIQDVEWWCSFPTAPWYNFEGGFGSLNQSLRENLRDGSINVWCGINNKENQ